MAKIPVFVSCPTMLNKKQESYNRKIDKILERFGLERRALGISDYPVDYPLKEVYAIAKHCAGGIILGFEQVYVENGVKKRGTDKEATISSAVFPTPWNHLEAGILYSLGLPLLIIKEKQVSGGIFDIGTSDKFIHNFDSDLNLDAVFASWSSNVYKKYRE